MKVKTAGSASKALEKLWAGGDCDLVLVGTPIDLARVIDIQKPNLRVTYELADEGPQFIEAIERAVTARKA